MLKSPDDNQIHVLNRTSVLLLELANGRHSVEEMVAILQAAFSLPYAPEDEVRDFLDLAVQAGLVE